MAELVSAIHGRDWVAMFMDCRHSALGAPAGNDVRGEFNSSNPL